MYGVLSPMQPGLPPIDADANVALDWGYTKSHRKWFPEPRHPDSVDLGWLAVASPTPATSRRRPTVRFRWDVSGLGEFECHEGLVPLGAVVDFGFDPQTRPPRRDAHRDRARVVHAAATRGGTRTRGWRCARSPRTCRWSVTSTGCTSSAAAARDRHPQSPSGRPSGSAAAVAARLRHAVQQRGRDARPDVQGRRLRDHLQLHAAWDVRSLRGHRDRLRPRVASTRWSTPLGAVSTRPVCRLRRSRTVRDLFDVFLGHARPLPLALLRVGRRSRE